MSKKNPPIPNGKPIDKVVRVGDLIDYRFSVVEHGQDDKGPFAILEVGPPSTSGVFRVTAIAVEGEGDEQTVTLSPVDDEVAKLSSEADGKIKEIEQIAERVEALIPKPRQPVIVREALLVRLTADEKIEAAKLASVLVGEVTLAEEELKQINGQRKAEIKELKAKIEKNTKAHNTGVEYREVPCEQIFDLEKERTWFLYRGEVYGARPMNGLEMRESARGLFGDTPLLPNKVNPDELPKPSEIAGDQLAKRAAEAQDRLGEEAVARGGQIKAFQEKEPKGLKPSKTTGGKKAKPPIKVESVKGSDLQSDNHQ